MIIRKPYAFLIKNFKKLHIFLLLLSLFVAYKLINVSSFINEFMNFGIYDAFNEPISKHISFLLSLSILLLIVGSISILLLLRHKKKPWKIYLVPFFEYLALFFVLGMVKSFFANYTNDIETTDLRLSRDLLFIFIFLQLPAIFIYGMRVFGLDISKFNFNMDQEFLELSEADREEVEISINVDKHSFKRLFKKFIRNINYFYLEHKGICRIVLVFIGLFIVYNSYKFIFVNNRSYTEGDLYSANGYSIKINKSYFTNKDYNGNVISNKSNFVILSLTIKNNSVPRKLNLDNFHIKNGVKDYTTTRKMYAKEFEDLGNASDSSKELKRDEVFEVIIIYKVDKNLKKENFVLFYQEFDDSHKLRKIKLNLEDLREIKEEKELVLGDDLEVDVYKKKDTISFNYLEFLDTASYVSRRCSGSNCERITEEFSVDENFKILLLEFGSLEYEAKNMIDFLTKYGKIVYKDSEGKVRTLKYENPIKKNYYGKSIFIKVPKEVEGSEEVKLLFTIRNKKHSYRLV